MMKQEKISYLPELRRVRHWLHQHPECAMEERETSRYIGEYLERLGLACRRLEPCGVIAEKASLCAGLWHPAGRMKREHGGGRGRTVWFTAGLYGGGF